MKMTLAALLGAMLAQAALSPASASARPNILLILTDDHGYHDLGCQGATDLRTPEIDRLAASGVRFTDGYVTSPQCGPSRAGILTGMSPQRFGYINNHAQNGLPSREVASTLPEQLRDLGYATGIIGKWHIGFRAKDGEATLAGNDPWDRGFDFSLTHDSGMSHFYPYRQDGWKWMTSRNLEPRLRRKSPGDAAPVFLDGLPEDTYLTDHFAGQAAQFVADHESRPWFLFLSFNAPHTPCVAKPDKLEKYAGIADSKRRAYAAMMDSVDEGVGRVLAELEKTGQRDRTLVWFLSDNGGPDENGASNAPLSGRKGDVHEGGIRVPFIVSWPGVISPPRVLSEPVISLDILPTSLAAAGASEVASIHEGRNLLPWLTGKAPAEERKLFWRWCHKSAVRIGSNKETRNGNEVPAADGSPVPGNVFSNIADNPQELGGKQLVGPEQRKLLSDELDAWQRRLEEDQKTLAPPDPGYAEERKPAAESGADAGGTRVAVSGQWAVRGPSDHVMLSDDEIELRGLPSGQPIALYQAVEPIRLNDGQTLEIRAKISTTKHHPGEADIRFGIGRALEPITDSPQIPVRMTGFLFSAPSGGASSGVRAARIVDTGKPEIYFNTREAGRPVATQPMKGSVTSEPGEWAILLSREGDQLLFSTRLGGESAAKPRAIAEDPGEEGFTFDTLAWAYAYSPGETLTVRDFTVRVYPAK